MNKISITRVVDQRQEQLGAIKLATHEFEYAYDILRRRAPVGDLVIHLEIETKKEPT